MHRSLLPVYIGHVYVMVIISLRRSDKFADV